MTRLPRTLRLDPSDGVVFERAAAPGEWAVPGGTASRTWPQTPRLSSTRSGQRNPSVISGGPCAASVSASALAAAWKARRAGPSGISGSSTTAASARP